MDTLKSMLEKLERRAKDDMSVFSKQEVIALLELLKPLSADSKISLNSGLDNGGENNE